MLEPQSSKQIVLNVNRKDFKLSLDSRTTLAEALRENLGLYGTKISCNRAECGSCTVLMNGIAVYSCTVLAVEAAGKRVETIEGLSDGKKLHPLQEIFIKDDALQCGYCTPGIIMSLKGLFDRPGKIGREDVRSVIAGNYCRCGAYPNIEKAAFEFLGERLVESNRD